MRDARLTVGKAYLLQAEEDLQAAKTIGNNLLTAPSTFCMLLQMVFEKLAKAEKYKAWEMLPTHLGHELASEYFAKFFSANMRMAPRQRKYSRLIGLIQELERLQPSVARRISENEPQLEYPWIDKNGGVRTPVLDLPLANRLRVSLQARMTAYAALKFAQEFVNERKVC